MNPISKITILFHWINNLEIILNAKFQQNTKNLNKYSQYVIDIYIIIIFDLLSLGKHQVNYQHLNY